MSGAPTVRLDRAREAHLFAHPEEATGEDVRGLVGSLREMRRAAIESAEAGGGVAVVVRMEDAGGGYLSMRITAPHMDDERIVSVANRMVRALWGAAGAMPGGDP